MYLINKKDILNMTQKPQKLPTCINKNFRHKLWVRDLHDFFVFLPSPTDSFVFFFSYIKVEKNRVHRVPH